MLNNAEPEPKAGALVATESRDLAVRQEPMVVIESTQAKVHRLWATTASFKALPQNKRHAQREAQAQHLRDAREIGQLLEELGVKHGGKRPRSPSVILNEDPDRVPTLKELGLTARESVSIQMEDLDLPLETLLVHKHHFHNHFRRRVVPARLPKASPNSGMGCWTCWWCSLPEKAFKPSSNTSPKPMLP